MFNLKSEILLISPDAVYVNSGEVVIGEALGMLSSGPLGSCVAIAAYGQKKNMCAMAHVMLPGKFSEFSHLHSLHYAEDSIQYILSEFEKRGVSKPELEVCLAGGANVLGRKEETIHKELVNSILNALRLNNIKVSKSALGGFSRRTLYFDTVKAQLYLSTAGNEKLFFWSFGTTPVRLNR